MAAPIDELVASSDAIGELRVRGRGGADHEVDPLPLPLRPRAGAQVPRGRQRPSTRPRASPPAPCTPSTPATASIDLLRGKGNDAPHPNALVPETAHRDDGAARRAAARGGRGARRTASRVRDAYRAARDLLLRPPATPPGYEGGRAAGPAGREPRAAGAAWPRPRRRTAASRSRDRPAPARPTSARG